VARYDLAGDLKWANRAGGTSDDYGYGIDASSAQEVFLTGSFTGTMKFTIPGLNLSYSVTSSGATDAFLMKFNANGYLVFGQKLGGAGYDFGTAVAQDNNGDIYLTGGYAPASNPMLSNVLVARYNASGGLVKYKTYGSGATLDTGNDIAIAKEGIYVTGYFGGDINFDGLTSTSKGGADAFVVRFSRIFSLSANSLNQFGGYHWDEGQSLAYRSGKLYVGGLFRGTASFGVKSLTSQGGGSDGDMFLVGQTADGTVEWAKGMGSTSLDYGRGGISLPNDNVIFFTGHHGSAITLGGTTVSGNGNLLTRINLPTVTDLSLVNAATDKVLNPLVNPATINYLAVGSDKINLRANVVAGSVGSVKFKLDGVTKTENAAPYTWAGDGLNPDGSTDYHAFTPSLGSHKLTVTPYSGANGTGVRGVTTILFFTVVNQPVVTGLTLYNAATDASLGALTSGQTINYGTLGTNQINIRANTNPGTVGSVRFNLDGVLKTENAGPYTWAGDALKPDGSTNYLPFTPGVGYHNLKVTPYSGANGSGTAGKTYEIYFYVQTGGFSARLAAGGPAPETDAASLTAAPNPFAGRTTLTFTATEDGPARLEVYSPAGTRTNLLFEGQVESGKTYQYAFDGATLPAGVYVGRLTTAGNVAHRKLVLGR
jgi:hypothetical protein